MKTFYKLYSLFKKKKSAFDECTSMEDHSVPLAQNGRATISSATEDQVDGPRFSRLIADDDTQTPRSLRWGGLAVDGIGSSRMTIDVTDEASSKESMPPLFLAIQIGDTRNIRQILMQSPELVNHTGYCGFPPIHHACNVKNIQALNEILQHGANICAYDALGNTPLHIAVNEAWHEGIITLLSNGASPDVRCEPPKSVKEMRLETPLHAAIRNGDLLSTTLLLEHKPVLTLRDSDHASVLHLAAQARNLEIVRVLIQRKECQEALNTGDRNGYNVLHTALQKECEPEAEPLVLEIVKLFAEAGADIDAVNLKGQTPLFLAARFRLPKLVELLLSLGADPSQVTRQGQTVLHAACYSGCASCLSHLLQTGLMKNYVIRPDNEGREPFHYAVRSSSIDCCELLLNNGDHLTRQDKDGISRYSLILNHLPSATQLLQRLFDAHVHLSNKPKHDPDFRITFDYSVLLSPDDHDLQSSLMSELTNSHLEPLLKHPLLESFLYYKWQKIKSFFYFSVFVYFIYLMTHTIFIILTFGHIQMNWCEHQGFLWVFIISHICMFILIFIPDMIILLTNFTKYIKHVETYSKLIALASSALVLFACTVPVHEYLDMGFTDISSNITLNETESTGYENSSVPSEQTFTVQNISHNVVQISFVRYAAAASAFFSWIEFMMLLGRFPSLGAYVLMFTRVAKSIIKFMMAFSSLLMGFALSFMVLFYNSPAFKNFPLSLIKTLMMMIGEIEYGDLLNEAQMPTITLISLVFFVFLVCIVMTNLLIGLAVNDIPDLQRQGKIRRLGKQAAYLVSYEKLIKVARNLSCFPSTLRILLATRSRILKEVYIYPNRECKSRKYKKCVPSETVQEAILLGSNKDAKEDLSDLEEEDMRVLFKSFRMKYSRDRKILKKKLTQLPDCVSINKALTERIDQMKQSLESRLMQLSLQIQQQLQDNQNTLTQLMQFKNNQEMASS